MQDNARVASRWSTQYPIPIIGVLVAFVLLGLVYTINIPIFEAPDEPWHFNYVRYVGEGRGLPSLQDNESGAYQEVGQPPLYYLIAGLVVAPVGEFNTQGLALHNPGFGYQSPGTVNDNKNLMAHSDREAFPWRGTLLAIHLARLVSLAFGALAVLATWGLAREIFSESQSVPLAAAAIVAFTPQFLFVSSVTSNDSSAAALSTAALWAIARMIRLGATLRRAALTGLLVGLASLTKTSTILLGVFAVAAIVFRPRAVDDTRSAQSVVSGFSQSRWSAVMLLMFVALAVGGWWYARNEILYGDPLGLTVHLNTPWGRPAPVSLMQVSSTLPLAYRSFWGAFGWGNVEMSPVIYYALATVLVIAAVGWITLLFGSVLRNPKPPKEGDSEIRNEKSAAKQPSSAILLMCLLWFSAIFVSFLRWNQQVEAPHGRLLYPALGAFALLLVAGLAQLPRSCIVMSVIVVGLLLVSLVTPFVYIRPAYAWPEVVLPQQIGGQRSVVSGRNLLYSDEARLTGFALDRPSVAPGEWLNVTLCWTAVKPMTHNYTMFIHLLGRENRVVGARDTWPGLGRFPTSLWPQDRAFCDATPVRVEISAPVPEVYAVEVGLYDAKTNDRLEATDVSTGQSILPPIVGQVRIAPKEPLRVSPQNAAQADFGGAALIGFDLPGQAQPGDSVPMTLYWRSVAKMDKDYTVFVHLLDSSGQVVAQADGEPRGGMYPTSAWTVGDVIPDEHTLKLSDHLALGDYIIRVGLYLAPDGPRLSLKPSGDSLPLGVLHVR